MLATSPNQVRPYSTSSTLCLLFLQKICQNIEKTIEIAVFHLFTECMDGLFQKITERCFKYRAIKQLKHSFNLPNNT